jgi:Holliday junction resolvase RusA-like endonuclease
MDFIITGEIKPYVRMTRRGKWGSPQAQEYLSSKAAIQMQLKEQMRGRERLGRVPIQVRMFISVADRLHTKDLDNQIKAVLDACNGIVWADDRWIDDISAVRYMDGHPDGALAQMEVDAAA